MEAGPHRAHNVRLGAYQCVIINFTNALRHDFEKEYCAALPIQELRAAAHRERDAARGKVAHRVLSTPSKHHKTLHLPGVTMPGPRSRPR